MTDEYEVTLRPPTTLKMVIPVVVLLAVLCCGGLGVSGYVVFRKVADAHAPIRDGAVAFLDDLHDGDYTAAYDRLCHSTQERLSRDAFVTAASGASAVRAYHIDQVRFSNDHGRLGGRVTTTLVNAAGAPSNRTFVLTSEDGAWKVCGDPFGS